MPSLSDILLERGAAGANAISRRGNIYADLIRNLSSAPGQVTQQLRSDQVENARAQEAQQRLGLQGQQLQLQQQEINDRAAQQASVQRGQAALSSAIQAHTSTDPETGHLTQDHEAIYSEVAKVDPQAADAYYQHATAHTKLINDIQNDTLAATQKKLQLQSNLVSSVLDAPPEQRAAAYAAMIGNVNGMFKGSPEIAGTLGKLPPEYSPALDGVLTNIRDSGTSQADKIKAAQEKATSAKTAAETAKLQKETAQIGQAPTMTPYQSAELKLRQGELGVRRSEAAQKAADAAVEKAKGKPLPAAEVDKITELEKSLGAVRDLRESLSQSGATGSLASAEAKYVPDFVTNLTGIGAEAKATAADIKLAQQVVGRIIHGGVLRASDQQAAEKYMPAQGDSPAVIKSKMDAVEKLGMDTRAGHLSNLGKAGFNVSGFQEAAVPPAAAPGGNRNAVAVTAPNGKTYTFMSQADADAFKAKAGL